MYHIHHFYNGADIYFPESQSSDLIEVSEVGHSTPSRGYTSLKNKRDVFVLHYVVSGKGSFADLPIEAPCVFLMTPDELQYYSVSPDGESPAWEQYWIMFRGSGAAALLHGAGFGTEQCVFSDDVGPATAIFKGLFERGEGEGKNDGLYLLSILFDLLSLHRAKGNGDARQTSKSPYVKKAKLYIKEFYASEIREDDIAASVHLSTKYLHRLFKNEVGEPPISYLNSYRVRCARRLLTESVLSVRQIAASVGLGDPNYFCRVFQKYNNGESPTAYRKRH